MLYIVANKNGGWRERERERVRESLFFGNLAIEHLGFVVAPLPLGALTLDA